MGNNDLRWAHALIKEQDAQIKEQKARAEKAEAELAAIKRKISWWSHQRSPYNDIVGRGWTTGVFEVVRSLKKEEKK